MPLYAQLADLIRSDITKGRLKKGDLLPTEKELGQLYGVSRITVRGALGVLADDGLILRKKGRGTIVKQGKLTRQAPGLLGIHEEIRAAGRTPETKLVSFAILSSTPVKAQKICGMERGEKVIKLERVVYSDNKILGLSVALIPLCIWEKTGIDPQQMKNKPLYRLLAKGGFQPFEAEETIEVIRANKENATRLDVPRGFPVFYLTRTVYIKEGIFVECGLNLYRADKYQFKMHHWRVVDPQQR